MNNDQSVVNFATPPYDFVFDYLRNSLSTAMLSLDSSGIITEANTFICQQLFQENLIGVNIRDFLEPKNHSLFDPGSSVSASPLILNFERQGYGPLLLFSHVYPSDKGCLVIGEQARLGDDQILSKMSLLNNELTTLARESHRETRHGIIAKQNLQKQADQLSTELSESESRYQSMFENNQTTMLIIDSDNACILDANPAACRFYGYERSTLRLMKITDINQLTEPEVFTEMALAKAEKRSYFRFKHLLANGNIRDVEVYSGPLEIFGQQCLYSIIHDVSERSRVEFALHQSEKKFRLLADHTYDWEYWVNPQGDYEYISPSCERITGYAPEEFMSDPQLLIRIVGQQEAETVWEHFKHENTSQEGICSLEFTIMTKAGQECWLEHQCFPIFDEQGKYIGRRGNNRDITQRKQDEAKQLELETQLAQKRKIEALGMMAGGMAHNFNNNLSIILGGIELTRIKLPGACEIKPLLDNAKTAVLRSRDLIQNILSYSRHGGFTREQVQMSQVVDETLKLLRDTIPSTVKIYDHLDPACKEMSILADSTRIQEALINLCNNAIQAMDEKGELTISLNLAELHPKDIPNQFECTPGNYFQLSVQDSGCGMTDDLVEKIFDPFFTTKSPEKGTGMGLATLHGMVLQYDGMIKVKSVPDQGSTFELYFPLSGTLDPEPEIINTALIRGSEKILFIDDDERLANLGETMLSDLGYQVCIMNSSIETFKLFQANPDHFDLVITDQTMPEMSGLELIRELRKIRPNLLTILCTGYSNKVDKDIAKKFEINAFLMKPLDLTALSQTIRQVLDGGKKI